MEERAFSTGDKAKVRAYGADDVNEGVAIMNKENVDVSIPGTRQILQDSSILLPGPIRSGPGKTIRSISQLLPAVVPAEPCTRTTMQPVRPLTD